MHIAVLSPQSPMQPSSSAVARLEMFAELGKEHTVQYFYFGEPAQPADTSIGDYTPEGHPRNFLALRRLIRELANQHRTKPFDIIWTTLPPIMMALFAVQAKKNLKLPLIVDVRDPGISSARLAVSASHPKYKLAWRLERSLYRAADAVCCTTPELCSFLTDEFNVSQNKLHVISNATIEKEKNTCPYPGKGPLTMFFAGTFAPYQVIEPFLEQIFNAKAEIADDFRFVFFGYEEKGANLPAKVREQRVGHYVDIQGRVPRAEVMRSMRKAHAVLVPIHGLDIPELYDYAVPLKYYEALAQSKPIFLFGGTKAANQALARDRAGVHCALKDNFMQALRDLRQDYDTYQRGATHATYLRRTEAEKLLAIMKTLCTSHS